MIDCAIAVLLHPSQAARLAAAWSLQSMAVAVPSHLTLLIDKYGFLACVGQFISC